MTPDMINRGPGVQFAAPGGRRCVGERPFCIESGLHR